MNAKKFTLFCIVFSFGLIHLFGAFEAPFSTGPYTYPYTPYASYNDSVGFYYGYDTWYDPWYNHCNRCVPTCYSLCNENCSYGNDHAPYCYQMEEGQSIPTIVTPKMNLWITINPSLKTDSIIPSTLDRQKQRLVYTQIINHIPEQNFSGHPKAVLLIAWQTKEYPFAFTYRVFHASSDEYVNDTSSLEKSKDMLYEGQANHYYLEKTDMHPQKHDYIWAQVLDNDGNVYAQSDLVLVD